MLWAIGAGSLVQAVRHRRNMRLVPTLATASLIVAGCGHRDGSKSDFQNVELRRRLAGTWISGSNGVLALHLDGGFSSAWTNWQANPPSACRYEGTWELTNESCYTMIAKAESFNTTNVEAVGSRDVWRLIRVDEHELVWEFDGRTNYLNRLQ
jgi:hypothetical protein